jgi:hypothetical protein
MLSMAGPKSVVCEAQTWTTTTVKEALAAKERFVRDPSRGAKAGDGPAKERCEVFRWVEVSVDEVLKLKARDPGLQLRCVECKMPVRVHRALLQAGSPTPHFEHYDRNPTCSRSDA